MEQMTIGAALRAARARFPDPDSASLDAQTLLGAVLGVERAYLLAHGEQMLNSAQTAQFAAYSARRAAGEPIAYILGRRVWYDREFSVSPAVLIPRPETELLLEQALAYADSLPATAPLHVVDVGTGSGALAVTFAALRPRAVVYATDISPAALALARGNAAAHGAQVMFLHGDLLAPLLARGLHVALIMANLPYIPAAEVDQLAVAQHEPRLALDGGADGLTLVRRLLAQVPGVLPAGGGLLLEIGAGQGAAALAAVRAVLPAADAVVLPDYAGHDRIVRVELA